MNQDDNQKGITKAEMVELFAISKAETMELLSVSKAEMSELLSATKTDIKAEIVKLFAISKTETVDLIDKVISVIDARIDSSIDSLKQELKAEIGDLRNDMNQRFLSVDRRLLNIETNMVYQHEFKPLVKRVEKLELAGM